MFFNALLTGHGWINVVDNAIIIKVSFVKKRMDLFAITGNELSIAIIFLFFYFYIS